MNPARWLRDRLGGPPGKAVERVSVLRVADKLLLQHSASARGAWLDLDCPVRVLDGDAEAPALGAAILTERAIARRARGGAQDFGGCPERLRAAAGLGPGAALWPESRLTELWFEAGALRVDVMRNIGRGGFARRDDTDPLRSPRARGPAEIGALALRALELADWGA